MIILIILLTTLVLSQGASADTPKILEGKWEVSEVHGNTNFGGKVNYGWNDPVLRWRIFDFSKHIISNNTPESDATACPSPIFSKRRVKFDEFLKMSLGGYGKDAASSPISDYKLSTAKSTFQDIYLIRCSDGNVWNSDITSSYPGESPVSYGSWILLENKNFLMLRWYDQTILVLSKIPPNTKPSPSFSCVKASRPAEQAICSSFELAGLDKSIAFAYQIAMREAKSTSIDTMELQHRQRMWLVERNHCGSDSYCILASMMKQLKRLRVLTG